MNPLQPIVDIVVHKRAFLGRPSKWWRERRRRRYGISGCHMNPIADRLRWWWSLRRTRRLLRFAYGRAITEREIRDFHRVAFPKRAKQ
jgi:hypothetical protein